MNSNSRPYKIFVGGLSLDTREDDLRMYFRQFGEVAGCIIKYDSNSSISRGFGFVSFNDHEVLINVLSKNHIIKGKQVDCKEAMTKEEAFQLNLELLNSRKKIFVGKVPRNVTKSVLYQYFSRYGVVEDVNLIFKKPKEGFAFVVFADNDTAEKALMEKNHVINETQLECKLALPRKDLTLQQQNQQDMSQIGGPQQRQGGQHPGAKPKYNNTPFYYMQKEGMDGQSTGHYFDKSDHTSQIRNPHHNKSIDQSMNSSMSQQNQSSSQNSSMNNAANNML